MLPERIGKRVREFREAANWSQEYLAKRLQLRGHGTVTQQRIQDIEVGKRVVRPDELVSLARVFKIPVSQLLGVPDFAEE